MGWEERSTRRRLESSLLLGTEKSKVTPENFRMTLAHLAQACGIGRRQCNAGTELRLRFLLNFWAMQRINITFSKAGSFSLSRKHSLSLSEMSRPRSSEQNHLSCFCQQIKLTKQRIEIYQSNCSLLFCFYELRKFVLELAAPLGGPLGFSVRRRGVMNCGNFFHFVPICCLGLWFLFLPVTHWRPISMEFFVNFWKRKKVRSGFFLFYDSFSNVAVWYWTIPSVFPPNHFGVYPLCVAWS